MGPGVDNASAMGTTACAAHGRRFHVRRAVRGLVDDSRVVTPHITFARIRGSWIDVAAHRGNRAMSDYGLLRSG